MFNLKSVSVKDVAKVLLSLYFVSGVMKFVDLKVLLK